MTDQRKQFEAWAENHKSSISLSRFGDGYPWKGEYTVETQLMWETWQEAQKSQWTEIDCKNPETWPEMG